MSNLVSSRNLVIRVGIGLLAIVGVLFFVAKFDFIMSLPLPVPEAIELRLNEYNRLLANSSEIELAGAFTLDKGKYRFRSEELGNVYVNVGEPTRVEAHVVAEIDALTAGERSIRIMPSLQKFDIQFSRPLAISGNGIEIATLDGLNNSDELTGDFSVHLANIVTFGLVGLAVQQERSPDAKATALTHDSITSVTIERLVMRFKAGTEFPTDLGVFVNEDEMRVSFTNVEVAGPKQASGNIEVVAKSIVPPIIEAGNAIIALDRASLAYRGSFEYQGNGLKLSGSDSEPSLSAASATVNHLGKSVGISSVTVAVDQIDAFVDGSSKSSSLSLSGRINAQELQYNQQDEKLKLQLTTGSPWSAHFSAEKATQGLSYQVWRDSETVVAIQTFRVESHPALSLDAARINLSPFSFSSLQDLQFKIPQVNASAGTLRIGDINSKRIGLVPSSTLRLRFNSPLIITPFGTAEQPDLVIDIDGKAKRIAIHDNGKKQWDFHDVEISARAKENTVSGLLSLSATNSRLGEASLAELAKGATVSIDKMEFTYDGDEFTLPSLHVQVSLPKAAVLDRLRREVSKPAKPSHEKIPGRDFGRILSLGTVKDYRSRTQVSGVKLNHTVFNGDSADVGVGGKITVALEAKVLRTGTKKCWTKGLKPCTKWLKTKLPFGKELKTKVPGLCETKWKADCPHVYHAWTRAASTTIAANIDVEVDLNPSYGHRLTDIALHPKVKLKNVDIKNVPGWLDKNFLTPFAKLFVPNKDLGEVRLFKSAPERTREILDKFAVKGTSINTEGDYIRLNINMSAVF